MPGNTYVITIDSSILILYIYVEFKSLSVQLLFRLNSYSLQHEAKALAEDIPSPRPSNCL